MNKRGRGRPKTIVRQHTVQRAMFTYWGEGIKTISLNEMCRRLGISKPSLYREFKDEDGLMEAVLLAYRELLIVPFMHALQQDAPFDVIMEQLIVAMTSEQDTPAGCLFTKMRIAREHLGPTTQARLCSIEQERRVCMESCHRRATHRLEVNASISSELASRYMDTQFNAMLMQVGMGEPSENIRAWARIAFDALCIQTTRSTDD